MKTKPFTAVLILLYCFLIPSYSLQAKDSSAPMVHVWEMVEIVLEAGDPYTNPYTDVVCWVELQGPGFNKRVYGFWDGGNIYRVRIVATAAGNWQWTSGSNQSNDKGLNARTGSFEALLWTGEELEQNPNRRGFIHASPNGHALLYADGSPCFLVGDTWLAGATWRLPYRNAVPPASYQPGPGIGFEDAVQYRKAQGFNSVSMIACFPNWESDLNPSTYADSQGVYLRNAWEKFEYVVADGNLTAKNMRDEYGHLPFEMSEEHAGVADFNRIVPAYFQSLDKKMEYLSEEGFVPLLETVRRDICPAWKAYYDFNESYARYVQYLIARYGARNFIFSGIHLDWIPKEYSLTADEFNEALTYHLKKYGPLPYGQPYTTLINNSTYTQFGHDDACPWLSMHSVGNKPRDHRVSDSIAVLFALDPPYPAINFEPYYTGWDHMINMPGGERPPVNSERDNYFARAQMYGSVLSGGLSGHVHGTAAYDITTTGEPEGMRPHFWDALQYSSGGYMQHLAAFMLSEGLDYQDLLPAQESIHPRKAPDSKEEGLDGWSYMMRTEARDLALLYFENQSVLPELSGFTPKTRYLISWYDTEKGIWIEPLRIRANDAGLIVLPAFPDGIAPAAKDWALKVKESI